MSYVVVLSKRRLLAAGEIVLALARAWESKLREYDPRAQLFSSGVRAEECLLPTLCIEIII